MRHLTDPGKQPHLAATADPFGLATQQGAACLAPPPLKGRGTAENPPVRYERQHTEPFDDGWGTVGTCFADLPKLRTTLTPDRSRSAIAWNDSPDLGFDRSVNPYRGCEHGCIYCYARPTHAWLGYSPGLDFETRLIHKPDVARLLERELRRPGYVPRTLALGSNTDPYQPVERTLGLTRQVLEVLERFGHPVHIVTKSAGVLRDLDILQRMARRNLVRVWLSVTTLDPALARSMEPRAAAPPRRLQAIEALAQAGVETGVMASPMIPGLNDMELERILDAAARAGARRATYVLLRLPGEVADLFQSWLLQHYPDRARRVLALVRQTRGGELYDSRFHQRWAGTGPYAELLAARFRRAATRLGLDGRDRLDAGQFAVPRTEEEAAQLSLL